MNPANYTRQPAPTMVSAMSNDTSADPTEPDLSIPDSIAAPATYLVTGTLDPAEHGLCLQILGRYAEPNDGALVVSTTESRTATIEQARSLCPKRPDNQFGVIDAVSRKQYISALYEAVPSVYTTTPRDLERIVLALSELTTVVRTGGSRHLVVRSLTPSLSDTNTDDVCRFLERISGVRTGSGFTFVGLDLSAHDDAVVRELLQRVDGVLWADERTDRSITVTVRSTRAVPFP